MIGCTFLISHNFQKVTFFKSVACYFFTLNTRIPATCQPLLPQLHPLMPTPSSRRPQQPSTLPSSNTTTELPGAFPLGATYQTEMTTALTAAISLCYETFGDRQPLQEPAETSPASFSSNPPEQDSLFLTHSLFFPSQSAPRCDSSGARPGEYVPKRSETSRFRIFCSRDT